MTNTEMTNNLFDENTITEQLRDIAARIADGKAAAAERDRVITAARAIDPDHWTQDRIARLLDMTQQAVSRKPAVDRSTIAWNLGALMALGDLWTLTGRDGKATPIVDKLTSTGRITGRALGALVSAVRADLAALAHDRHPKADELSAVLAAVETSVRELPESESDVRAAVRRYMTAALDGRPALGKARTLAESDEHDRIVAYYATKHRHALHG